jgi:hypothetical protein
VWGYGGGLTWQKVPSLLPLKRRIFKRKLQLDVAHQKTWASEEILAIFWQQRQKQKSPLLI